MSIWVLGMYPPTLGSWQKYTEKTFGSGCYIGMWTGCVRRLEAWPHFSRARFSKPTHDKQSRGLPELTSSKTERERERDAQEKDDGERYSGCS